jgi:hypothetical protein
MPSHCSMQAALSVLAIVVMLQSVCAVSKDGSDMKPRVPLRVDDLTVQKAAKVSGTQSVGIVHQFTRHFLLFQFAMDELRVISDSGVFETLVLDGVLEAAFQEGVYHNNIFLTVQLSSPYMATPDKKSKHEARLI